VTLLREIMACNRRAPVTVYIFTRKSNIRTASHGTTIGLDEQVTRVFMQVDSMDWFPRLFSHSPRSCSANHESPILVMYVRCRHFHTITLPDAQPWRDGQGDQMLLSFPNHLQNSILKFRYLRIYNSRFLIVA
jgi:hypothetical protein